MRPCLIATLTTAALCICSSTSYCQEFVKAPATEVNNRKVSPTVRFSARHPVDSDPSSTGATERFATGLSNVPTLRFSALDQVLVLQSRDGGLRVNKIPATNSIHNGQLTGIHRNRRLVRFTVDPVLQSYTDELVKRASSPHVAIVAMEPYTGRVLAASERSPLKNKLYLHNGFPAASLFKIITSAAALETKKLKPDVTIKFRGGNYTLNKWNYKASKKYDRRSMSFEEALGRSVNPVFARIALQHLDRETIRRYTDAFGFNSTLDFDLNLPVSSANIPGDAYGLARTAAGFGKVTITPIHAVTLMSAIANGGFLPRPSVLERIASPDGLSLHEFESVVLGRVLRASTAETLMDMMESTVTVGTSKKYFFKGKRPLLPGVRVAAKTGTLKGKNPTGTTRWFVGAAPIENPSIALAIVVVDTRRPYYGPSRLAQNVMNRYLKS